MRWRAKPSTADSNASADRGRRNDGSFTAEILVEGLTVDAGGVPVHLRAADLRRAQAMEFVNEMAASREPARVFFSFGDHDPPPPDRPPDEIHGELLIWRRRDVLFMAYRNSLRARASGRRVDIAIGNPDLYRAVVYLFPFMLAHALSFHERLVLFGGALCRGRGALLVLGDTGSGKSTTVMAALRGGWRALSDDLVVLRQRGRGVEVSGLPKPFYVPGDVASTTADAIRPLAGASRGRWLIRSPDWVRGPSRLAGSVFLQHGRSSGERIEALSRKALCGCVECSFPEVFPGTTPAVPKRTRPVAKRLSRLPGWRISLPPDPSDRLDELACQLDEVASRLGA